VDEGIGGVYDLFLRVMVWVVMGWVGRKGCRSWLGCLDVGYFGW